MDPKIKDEWLKALRSGKYKQCAGRLASDEGFCCIGVLYDIAVDGWWECTDGGWRTSIGQCTASLHPSINREIGLSDMMESCAARMNDKGMTFPEIADWIEHNL